MSNTTANHSVKFLGDQDQVVLRNWYGALKESELKASIRIIKSREFRPYEEKSVRLVVLCTHPFKALAREIESATESEDYTKSDRALSTLVSSFTSWIESQGAPGRATFAARQALIDWWPVEMLPYVAEELSLQAEAQLEMSNHILECLDLIRLSTISDPEFLSLWIDSNEPNFAAGRLFHGTFRWVDEVPNFAGQADERADMRERVRECAREYVGLARLSLLAGAESPLLERTAFVLRRFKVQFAAENPKWLALGRELLEGSQDVPIHSAIATPADYEGIDSVCDRLRNSLAEAIDGMEDEISTLINALLPTLSTHENSVRTTPI